MNRITITVTGPKGSAAAALAELILNNIRSMGFQAGLDQKATAGAPTTLSKMVMGTIVSVESRDEDLPVQQELGLVIPPPAPKAE